MKVTGKRVVNLRMEKHEALQIEDQIERMRRDYPSASRMLRLVELQEAIAAWRRITYGGGTGA